MKNCLFLISLFLTFNLFINNQLICQENSQKIKRVNPDSAQLIDIKPREKRLNSVSENNATPVDEISTSGKLIIAPDRNPLFPGGQHALDNYIKSNLIYPEEAKKNSKEGVVIVTFSIETDGTVTSPEIITDKVGFGASEEVKRLILSMPKWVPGYKQDVPFPVNYSLPVFFKLNK